MRFLAILSFFCLQAVNADNLPSPLGKRYDIGGYKMHLHCQGKNGPTVVVDAGLGEDSSDWQKIVDQVRNTTRICVLDRPGYGWSDFGPTPRTSERIAGEIERLLSSASIGPPYLLVGHSFGGFNVRMFAARHPNQVKGMILIDASHEEQFNRLKIRLPRPEAQHRSVIILPKGTVDTFSSDKPQALKERSFFAARAEITSMSLSAKQVGQLADFPEIPLVIISRGQPEWTGDPALQLREKIWIDLQRELTHLTSNSRHLFAHKSGHAIPQQQPQIIVDTILEMLDEVRFSHPSG
ncbi:putative hydrolase or acyltransferase of alpha/beta superfamily [Methylophaga frappieri]|uniref:Putative hydrolase or acyltransferase of alpha/beta superfamily n=1 Tax=Methylophaga frappieri (strain ATCC BAA-2434 / DSM 25690 / JAM7) TaxID=754477 RepID=I1YGM2_METFJ|nr:alpha/beta hydrolase [Methylophaga frappieri]AFJ02065.1 putative hydrolase or acyltransferase of alpha/beta superfamily [Methylophaga frappieri]